MTKDEQAVVARCAQAAHRIRRDCLVVGSRTGSNGAHFGGSLSMVEIMATLYLGVMRVDPSDPLRIDRDRFILSKGHGALAYYSALREVGLVTENELLTFKSNDTFLYGHPSMNPERGIEFSSGSLGQGLALGVGTALGLRLRGQDRPVVYVVIGDGECDEGSIWESAQAAAHFGLHNLVAIVDSNGLQYDGPTRSIMDLGDLAGKWRSFGWDAHEVDGHDVASLYQALRPDPSKPRVVVAHTIKGKGVSFMEHDPAWHHARLSAEQLALALAEQEA